MPRHRVRFVAASVSVVALGLVVAFALAPSAATVQAQSPLLGKPAPPIAGLLVGGGRFDLEALFDQVVIIDFFASWCVACQKEQPELDSFVAEHGAQSGVRFVGVVFYDTASAIRSFLGPEAGRFPVVEDPSGTIALTYGVSGPPEKYVIGPDGRVVAKLIGPVTHRQLDRVLTGLSL